MTYGGLGRASVYALEMKGEYGTLAKERIWGEWEKWALKGVKPSAGLTYLMDTGWLELYPELAALVGCPQDPVWHPESYYFRFLPTHSGIANSAKSESFVPDSRFIATGANKVIRVMFPVTRPSMFGIVDGAVNNLKILQSVISSISIFMVDVLTSGQSSVKMQFHNKSVEIDPPVIAGPSSSLIPFTVVPHFTSNPVYSDGFVTFDLFIKDDNHSGPFGRYLCHLDIGDAWNHTLFVCDAMAELCSADGIVGNDRIVLMFAALCHDLGKPLCTAFINGRWRSPGHDKAGVPLAESFLNSLGMPVSLVPRVLPLVAEHMVHVTSDITPRTVRRLAVRLVPANLNQLMFVIKADTFGRPPLPKVLNEKAIRLEEIGKEVKVELDKPAPIVLGRHLIELGMKPGPEMGKLLKHLYEAQLDGEFDNLEDGKSSIAQLLAVSPNLARG